MTKGQRAMAVAMMFPDPEKRGRGDLGDRVDHQDLITTPELVESVPIGRSRPAVL